MENYWIVVGNASTVKIYTTFLTKSSDFELVYGVENLDSRKKNSELSSDRSGHIQSDNPLHTTFVPPTTPKSLEEENFARKISQMLDTELQKNSFSKLIILSSPKFFGLLKKHFSKTLSNISIQHINKDYTQLTIPELSDVVKSIFKPLL